MYKINIITFGYIIQNMYKINILHDMIHVPYLLSNLIFDQALHVCV